jgi:hypothetical protein
MQLCNEPDIALAQEWIGELDAWIVKHGLVGYDPFDVKQHPCIRAAQTNAFTRKAATALCDLFPLASRRLLRIAPTENPKAHALVAMGLLRLHAVTKDAAYLERALSLLDRLRELATPGQSGLCWGYPFDIHAKGLDTPKGTPVLVISAIAGEAFLTAYEITQDAAHLDAARSIARFITSDLPRLEAEEDAYCFAYTPTDRRRVHNANMLAVEHLLRVGAATGEAEWAEAAEPALRFTLSRQRADGSWTYGETAPGEAYEEGLLKLVDHHHTGFVLRSLHAVYRLRKEDRLYDALRKGFKYYQKLATADGMPINAYGRWPVDIHACAEAVLCPSALSETFAGGKKLAIRCMCWAWYALRDPKDGSPWHRKYPFHTAKIVFPRWGVAWMYRALAEFLYHFNIEANPHD